MLRPFESSDVNLVVSIWNAACGPDLAINSRLVEYNTRPATGAIQAIQLAVQYGQPVGLVHASVLPADPATSPPEVGWIDALAVLPEFQRQGIGGELLAWAEVWLAEQGCARIRLGGGLHYFVPGLPVELGTEAFFHKRGFQDRDEGSIVWDVASDLDNYQNSNLKYQMSNVSVRPGQAGQENALLDFLRREFPGRWRFECEEFLRERGRMSDYVILWTERGIDGCCRLTLEDSERPIERYYLHRLPHPWGQLGSIGVSRDCRGKGYGGALLEGGLRQLRDKGVRGCVIDWTNLVDFYGKFGFKPYHQYTMLIKQLTNGAKNV